MCDISVKVLTLDGAIAHAEECADNTPCGQNHKQLAEWLKELDRLKTTPIGNIYALRQALVKAHTMLKVCECPKDINMKGVADVMKEIEDAIDAPARNCDRFKTKEEAAIAFANENKQWIPQQVLWELAPWLDWLFATAEIGRKE